MSVVMAMATVPASSTVPVFTVPPGMNNAVIFQVSQPQAVYVGTSAHVSTTTGMQVPLTPLSQEIYIASTSVTYYATTGNGTAASFSYIISSAK
jgi:hypothetical protein